MSDRIQGLHHITLCTGTAQGDVDFFVKTLGLRLMKRTLLVSTVAVAERLFQLGCDRSAPQCVSNCRERHSESRRIVGPQWIRRRI